MNNSELVNGIRKNVEGYDKCIFPLNVFPIKMQNIIMDAVKHDGLEIECLAASMISATATAIGNALALHVRGSWYTNSSLYMIIVARPGTGKTHAMSFAYSPISDRDMELGNEFRKEMADYKMQLADGGKNALIEKPHIRKCILTDFTPEALYRQLFYNQRGVCIFVDEILGLFKSRNRYTSDSKLVEDFLSSFSGSPITLMRKDEESIITIPRPCINIIGGIQTDLVQAFFSDEFMANGFTDRLLFIKPENQKIKPWTHSDSDTSYTARENWSKLLSKIMDIECDFADDGLTIIPKTLEMTKEAEDFFYEWNNSIVDLVNSIEDDKLVDTHVLKLNGILPRLALTLQALRWAAGETTLNQVDIKSFTDAKLLIDYFEGKYNSVKRIALTNGTNDIEQEWISKLPEKFTTEEAAKIWVNLGMQKRSMFNHIKSLCILNPPVLKRLKTGYYEKVHPQDSSA